MHSRVARACSARKRRKAKSSRRSRISRCTCSTTVLPAFRAKRTDCRPTCAFRSLPISPRSKKPAREFSARARRWPEVSARAGAGGTPLLFTPLALRGLTARNRVVVSPMCQYSSRDGGPTDWHLVHLGKFALGGAAIVFCEETAVEERARKTYGCAGIYAERFTPMYHRITDFLRNNGALPAIQLGHSGRKASCGPPW